MDFTEFDKRIEALGLTDEMKAEYEALKAKQTQELEDRKTQIKAKRMEAQVANMKLFAALVKAGKTDEANKLAQEIAQDNEELAANIAPNHKEEKVTW